MTKHQKKNRGILAEILSWVVPIVLGVVIFLAVQTYVAQSFEVSGPSMEPTLQTGDRMFMFKLGDPKRFDIVVLQAPDNALDSRGNVKEYVKRVIGMPGDHVAYRNNILYINGQAVEEPFLKEQITTANAAGTRYTPDYDLTEATGLDRIPAGHYFVLGDNRMNSKDSTEFGLVKRDLIDGTASLRYWPFNRFGIISN